MKSLGKSRIFILWDEKDSPYLKNQVGLFFFLHICYEDGDKRSFGSKVCLAKGIGFHGGMNGKIVIK